MSKQLPIRMTLKGLLSALLISLFSLPSFADEANFSLGLYVVVDNMAESREFYQQLFKAEPYVDNGDFVGFRIPGGLFALYGKDAFDHELVRGNNAVPYIRVTDIDAEFRRIKMFAPQMVHQQVLKEGPIQLFMFHDPSGNAIEFYSFTPE